MAMCLNADINSIFHTTKSFMLLLRLRILPFAFHIYHVSSLSRRRVDRRISLPEKEILVQGLRGVCLLRVPKAARERGVSIMRGKVYRRAGRSEERRVGK